jgi:cell division septation protein DedD
LATAVRPGRFVVQLGAFKSASQVESAWERNQQRFRLAAHQPLSTTVSIPGRGIFHRLSVSGFGSRGEASSLCGSIRTRGGACFVRRSAGDTPLRWASRS